MLLRQEENLAAALARAESPDPTSPSTARRVTAGAQGGPTAHCQPAEGKPADQLSDREPEILILLSRGHANKLIARKLEIAENTVKNHITRVFEVLTRP